MLKFFALFFALSCFLPKAATQVITLPNPSFEDTPEHSKTPARWENCGFTTESPPDILPDPTFQVDKVPFDGKTYVGLVTRDNDTWESIGAGLSSPLEKNKCYGFQIALSRSTSYYSVSRARNVPANYVSPVRLLIWASNGNCGHDELLAQTEVIDHFNWKLYSFNVRPTEDSYTHLVFEVFYPENTIATTNGNLLLDGMSEIIPIVDCEKIVADSDFSSAQSEEPLIELELPANDLLANKRRPMRKYLGETLSEIQFYFRRGGLELVEQEFQLVGEEEIRKGSPQLYAIQNALTYYPDEKWILVVRDVIERRQRMKARELAAAISYEFTEEFRIEEYSPRLHSRTKWLAADEAAGLYLIAFEK